MFKTLGIKLFNLLFPLKSNSLKKTYEGEIMTYIPTATIVPTNGRFALVRRGGSVLKTYSRRRDAVRGAERLGLTLA